MRRSVAGVCVIAMGGACHPPPVETRVGAAPSTTVTTIVVTSGRWIDEAAGVAAIEVQCTRGALVDCPVVPLTIRSPWGTTATASLDVAGTVGFTIAPPPVEASAPSDAAGWIIDGPDGPLAWGLAREPAAPAPARDAKPARDPSCDPGVEAYAEPSLYLGKLFTGDPQTDLRAAVGIHQRRCAPRPYGLELGVVVMASAGPGGAGAQAGAEVLAEIPTSIGWIASARAAATGSAGGMRELALGARLRHPSGFGIGADLILSHVEEVPGDGRVGGEIGGLMFGAHARGRAIRSVLIGAAIAGLIGLVLLVACLASCDLDAE